MQELAKQLSDPDHCFLLFRDGKYFSHSVSYADEENGRPVCKRGSPVRFTRLAAERMLQRLPGYRMEPAPTPPPELIDNSRH